MTKEEAYKLLDKVVDAIEYVNSFQENFKELGVETCSKVDYINISSGIFKLCEVLGIKPERKWWDNGSYDIKVFFMYRGVEFLSLYNGKIDRNIDINSVELVLKDSEKETESELFKEMDKVIEDFDRATTYNHEDSGVLGKV